MSGASPASGPPPRRVSVVGNTGAGKTTLAVELARRLDVPHVELDALFHQPGWKALPRDEFRRRVRDRIGAAGWVVDGNYTSNVQDIVWRAADTVVWLDLPRRKVLPALTRRTLSRMLLGTELWNGNRERLRNLFSLEPETNILVWSWTQHAKYRRQYARAMADSAWSHLAFKRLCSRAQASSWLAEVGPSPKGG